MLTDNNNLPDDPAQLKKMLVKLSEKHSEELQQENKKLKSLEKEHAYLKEKHKGTSKNYIFCTSHSHNY